MPAEAGKGAPPAAETASEDAKKSRLFISASPFSALSMAGLRVNTRHQHPRQATAVRRVAVPELLLHIHFDCRAAIGQLDGNGHGIRIVYPALAASPDR